MSSFKLWRDGLILAALIFGGFYLFLSSFGFETRWSLERWNGAAVAPGALQVSFFHPRRRSFSLLLDTAMPRKRDQARLTTNCGRYEAKYERGSSTIAIDPPSGSPCPQEASLIAAFSRAHHYALGDGSMTLTTSDGQTLVFRRDGVF